MQSKVGFVIHGWYSNVMKLPFRKIRGGKSADERSEKLKDWFSKVPRPWSRAPHQHREKPFVSISQRIDRAKAARDWLMIVGLLGGLGTALYFGAHFKGWTFTEAARHIVAFPNCSFARMVGLDLAREGEPGYYGRHDADNDGVACEPLPK